VEATLGRFPRMVQMASRGSELFRPLLKTERTYL
jgi:hypothetical protein